MSVTPKGWSTISVILNLEIENLNISKEVAEVGETGWQGLGEPLGAAPLDWPKKLSKNPLGKLS